MSMEDLRQLAKTYHLLSEDRKALRWKMTNGEPEDDWLKQAGLSHGHVADLRTVENRLFSDVMHPLVKKGLHASALIRAIRAFCQYDYARPLAYPLTDTLGSDQIVLLAKRFIDLDAAIWDVGVRMQDAEPVSVAGSPAMTRHYLEESMKLEEEQAEIRYQFAYHGLDAMDLMKAQEDYKRLSVAAYRELVARAQ